MFFSEKQKKKIVKETILDMAEQDVYENGLNRESVKKNYDFNNDITLQLLKNWNKNKKIDQKIFNMLKKEMFTNQIKLYLSYFYLGLEFLFLTFIFGGILYFITKYSNNLNVLVQRFIFSVFMIIYSAVVYSRIGDKFKISFYSNYCLKYSKKRFLKNYKAVLRNIEAKKALEKNLIIGEENIRKLKNSTKVYDSCLENTEKL